MPLDIDKIIPPSVRKAIEISDRLGKIAAIPAIFQKQAMINNILIRSGILTPKLLKSQPKGIKRLVESAGHMQRMAAIYTPEYLQQLEKLFPKMEILERTEPLEVTEYDFFPEGQESSIEVFTEVPKLERMIASLCLDNQKLYNIHPDDMEELIGEILRKEGWEVKLTKKTRDGGLDMYALQQIGGIEFKMIAEVKRWAKHRKIGVGIIRSFQSVIQNQGVNKGVLFTSSTFSKDAKDHQGLYMPHLMDLRDYDDIIGWISNNKL